jgi:cystathionine gamma-synthase
MLFPSASVARRCGRFIKQHSSTVPPPCIRVVEFTPRASGSTHATIVSGLSVVFFPATEFKVAKQFWQHSGDGVSSRRAEFCQQELEDGVLVEKGLPDELSRRPAKGPKRYSRVLADKGAGEKISPTEDMSRFVEERFGRNLGVEFVANAKLAVRRRIAGTLRSDVTLSDAIALSSEGGRDVDGFTEEDVYLFPTGMSAIFNSHRLLMETLEPRKSVCYGYALPPPLHSLQTDSVLGSHT